MSYIDDLRNAAERANVASDRADDASKIIYDVAHGPVDEIVHTENGPVLTLSHAISRIQYLGGLDIAGLPEASIPLSGDELFVVVQEGADVNLTLKDIQDSITAGVESVNGLEGAVVLTTDEVMEGDLNKYFTASDKLKLEGIEVGAEANDVLSVNNKIGIVVLSAEDVGAIDVSEKGSVNGVATLDTNGKIPESQLPSTVTGAVQLVNGQSGVVILNTDDISEGVNNKYFSSTHKNKLDSIESGAEQNTIYSVNGQTGDIVLGVDDVGAIADAPANDKLYGRKNNEWVEINQSAISNLSTVISYPTDGETDVNLDLTITTEPFESPFAENHVSTDWVILESDGETVAWESLSDTENLTSIALPSNTLEGETTYIVRARFYGSVSGDFPWSEDVTFTTEFVEQSLPEPGTGAGTPYGGGYYAGANIVVGGKEYALIVAPKTQGGEASSGTQWKTTNSSTSGTDSLNDGRSNTLAMISAGASEHPAAEFCNNLDINGYTDWHLPSQDELEICYRYLKPSTNSNSTSSGSNSNSVPVGDTYTSSNPSQTSSSIFRRGGGEDFGTDYHWSSTQGSSTFAWNQNFSNGSQTPSARTNLTYVRAVRWVEV